VVLCSRVVLALATQGAPSFMQEQCFRCSSSTCANLRGFVDEEEGLDDDEALARRLQEQEDALATRGRATRGALRVTLKPKPAAQKGPIRGSGSRAVRSSSRLKPQAAQSKEGPTTRGRGSAGVHPKPIWTMSLHSGCDAVQ